MPTKGPADMQDPHQFGWPQSSNGTYLASAAIVPPAPNNKAHTDTYAHIPPGPTNLKYDFAFRRSTGRPRTAYRYVSMYTLGVYYWNLLVTSYTHIPTHTCLCANTYVRMSTSGLTLGAERGSYNPTVSSIS